MKIFCEEWIFIFKNYSECNEKIGGLPHTGKKNIYISKLIFNPTNTSKGYYLFFNVLSKETNFEGNYYNIIILNYNIVIE